MADALVSIVKEQVQSTVQQQIKLIVGVDDELDKISVALNAIQGVLNDAEKRQMNEGEVKVWLDELKDISYGIDDVLDEWSTRTLSLQIEVTDTSAFLVRKVCTSFRCFCLDEAVLHRVLFFLSRFGFNQLLLRRNIAHRIRHIRNRLDWIADEKNKYHFNISESSTEEEPERIITSSIVTVSKVFGRDSDKDYIISKLLSEISHQSEGLPFISIIGMGGLGKTTLAQLVFNDDRVKNHFDKKMWVCVSKPFDKIGVAKAIIEASGEVVPEVHSWEALHQHLSKSVEGKLLLLVVDDIWTEDQEDWEPFRESLNSGAPGSRLIVTTRNERVAIMMGSKYRYNVGTLSVDDSWALLSDIAFFDSREEEHKEFEEIGKKIALKCKGLPLAAKTLGSLLRFKRTRRGWLDILESETWKLQGVEKGVLPPLLLSYYDLPSPLKCCLSYCAVFRKDEAIYRPKLISLWMAQGFLSSTGEEEMERVGGEYFDNLVMRSFLHPETINSIGFVWTYNMHDLMHDLVQFLVKKECLVIEKDANKRVAELGCSAKTRHLTLVSDDIKGIIPSVCKAVNLRTLRILNVPGFCIGGSFPVSFCNLTCLRSLDLSKNKIENVPNEIEKLIHLRYLDLSYTMLKELPEAVSKLHNLQTLDLRHCKKLVKLPQGIVNLRKMRHLHMFGTRSLTCLPEGIGRLSSLRTLTKFIVSGNGDGCRIRELSNLDHLTGFLSIAGLGNVKSRDEARELELWNKFQIRDLALEFDGNDEGNQMCESVLEGLQPPANLESLTINQYPSTKFPKDWLTGGDDGLELSCNLRVLTISDCRNCLRLSLPKLPSLEVLEIKGLERVRYMERKFFGIRDEDDATQTREMNDEDDEDDNKIMPNLSKLTLTFCFQLKALPRYLSHQLRVLQVKKCPALNWPSSCLQFPLLEELILIDNVGVLSQSLARTRISLPALKSLEIVRSLRSSLPEGLCHLTALRVLRVSNCDNIKNLSEELQHLTTIQELHVYTKPKERRKEGVAPTKERKKEVAPKEGLKEVAENLSKILSIPHVYFQGKRIR